MNSLPRVESFNGYTALAGLDHADDLNLQHEVGMRVSHLQNEIQALTRALLRSENYVLERREHALRHLAKIMRLTVGAAADLGCDFQSLANLDLALQLDHKKRV